MPSKPTHTPTNREPTHEEIAARARSLWAERGNPAGRDLEHWLEAERQLRERGEAKKPEDVDEAEKRLDGLVERTRDPARRTPKGEQL